MHDTRHKKKVGNWGEEKAASFLETLQYTILERNYRTKRGEIDIIANVFDIPTQLLTLCFIEVKTRGSDDGSAVRAVDVKKRKAASFAARTYCFEKGIDIDRTAIQFEQITIVYQAGKEPEIRHYVLPAQ